VEKTTDEMEERIWELMKEIERRGGFVECFKAGWVENELNQARYKLADQIESAELPIIGMNMFRGEEKAAEIKIFTQAPDMQAKRIEYAISYKKNPNRGAVKKALDNLADRVKKHPDKDLVVPILEATEAKATLQEISDAMREALGWSIPG